MFAACSNQGNEIGLRMMINHSAAMLSAELLHYRPLMRAKMVFTLLLWVRGGRACVCVGDVSFSTLLPAVIFFLFQSVCCGQVRTHIYIKRVWVLLSIYVLESVFVWVFFVIFLCSRLNELLAHFIFLGGCLHLDSAWVFLCLSACRSRGWEGFKGLTLWIQGWNQSWGSVCVRLLFPCNLPVIQPFSQCQCQYARSVMCGACSLCARAHFV